MHITELEIKNLRSIGKAVVGFTTPASAELALPNVNVLLGGNGAGKTTVLRAAALAMLAPLLSQSSGYVPEGMIRRKPMSAPSRSRAPTEGRASARLDIAAGELPAFARTLAGKSIGLTAVVDRLGDAERIAWSSSNKSQSAAVERLLFDTKTSAFFVVGYGATRRVEASTRVDESARIKSRARRYERVSSLFEEHVGLMPLSYWLPEYARRNPGRHVQVVRLLNELLPPNCRIQDQPSDTANGLEHLFEMNGIALPFRALSDGYRAYLGWIGDMLFHLCMGTASGLKLRETQGVALVDEIDLHLHPEWQRTVVPTLARALPRMQFIVTTHSPLVVGSLEAGNLQLLHTDDQDGSTEVRQLPELVHGRSAEQILLSPYFGLASTRAEGARQRLHDLAQASVGGDRSASVEYLKVLAKGLPAARRKATPSKA